MIYYSTLFYVQLFCLAAGLVLLVVSIAAIDRLRAALEHPQARKEIAIGMLAALLSIIAIAASATALSAEPPPNIGAPAYGDCTDGLA